MPGCSSTSCGCAYGHMPARYGGNACTTTVVSPKVRRRTDVAGLREQAGLPVERRLMPSARLMDADAVAVLDAWAAMHRDPP